MTDAEKVGQAVADARTSRRGWWRAFCPLCPARKGSEDKKESLGVKERTGFYHCFRCGAKGWIDASYAPEAEADQRDDGGEAAQRMPSGFEPLDGDTSITLRPARRYLRRRGIRTLTVAAVGIGACPSGPYAGRVVVPVRRPDDGALAGWVARAWDKRAPKPYLYPPGMDRVLFNGEAIRVETTAPVLVVEGVFDALPHYPHAVACLGKPTRDQVDQLGAARRPVVVALDGDAWREGAALAMDLVLRGVPAAALRFPATTDPNDIGTDALIDAARQAVQRPGDVQPIEI